MPQNLGLLANGSSGGWEVSVDETTSGPNRWFLQIEGPTAYCSFEIPSLKTITNALEFLQGGRSDDDGSPVIGKSAKNPVVLLRDDEFRDRYFLLIGPTTAIARVTVAGGDLEQLTEALRQASEDIRDES